MKNGPKQKPFRGRGPLARKVINSARQQLHRKVTSLCDWKEGKIKSEEYQKSIVSDERLSKLDPLHALYAYSQNHLSVLIDQITESPILDKLAGMYTAASEEYMPSSHPMSPLTISYFTCWGAFDLCTFGEKKETLCTVVADYCKYINADYGQIEVFEEMQNSYMGIYKHEGRSGEYINFRELVTNRELRAFCPSAYKGREGELWFVRIFPPLFGSFNYSVVFTTPYILGKFGSNDSFMLAVENDWLNYFKRNLGKNRIENIEDSYQSLMKYGLSKNYWNKYIFLSYRKCRDDIILLEGFPDIQSSMPHAK